ncbi:MAG: Gfo/Idh/MocA family oxidoreductase, partial [Chloroflexi bacterium]|nr:Gfo/Idh/MocA family oxidoreductase [Chloroflexota bacterium]
MSARSVGVAQVGCGYWGPNLLRNLLVQPQCRVKWLVEASPERRAYVERSFERVTAIPELSQALEDPEVDAVVVATPASTHFAVVKQCLQAGKHVLVEKPVATSTVEADTLVTLANRAGCILMVGHTFLYNNAVRYTRTLLEENQLGDLFYIYNQRLNLGQVRSDVNVWWN